MRPEHQRAVTEALSAALVAVAKKEFARLSQGLSEADAAQKVEQALSQLAGLRWDKTRDYRDPWVVLFYILLYQPSHINLAYSTIRELLKGKGGRVQIVDFGAGALAAQFGVALALAERGTGLRAVVESIDNSQEMLDAGTDVWGSFTNLIAGHNRSIRSACDRTRPVQNKVGGVRPAEESRKILSAFHAAKSGSREDVAKALRRLASVLEPDSCIATAQASKEDIARYVLPANQGVAAKVKPQFRGHLPRVTEIRKRIWSSIGRPTGITARYLNWPVVWKWPDSAILIHNRPR